MDIKAELKEKIEQIVEKIKSDKTLLSRFEKDPVSVVEQLLDIDLPNDQLEPLVDAIKAKLDVDKLKGMLGGLGGLFGK
jgi:hypothetical protein